MFPELIPILFPRTSVFVFFKFSSYFYSQRDIHLLGTGMYFFLVFRIVLFGLARFDIGTLCSQGGFCLPVLDASWTLQRKPKAQISRRKASNSYLYTVYPVHTYLIPNQATQQTMKADVARILLSRSPEMPRFFCTFLVLLLSVWVGDALETACTSPWVWVQADFMFVLFCTQCCSYH